MKVEITIANEDGIVIDQFLIDSAGTGAQCEIELSRFAVEVLENHFDCEAAE